MCIGQDALEIFHTLSFDTEEEKANMDTVLTKMEHYFVGKVNILPMNASSSTTGISS